MSKAGRKFGYKVSQETRKKISDSTRGEKATAWKGGKPKCYECGGLLSYRIGKRCMKCIKKNAISPVNMIIRKSVEYKLWREAVFKRDNYTCIWGGKEHGNKLNADHIKSFAHFPELRFAIDNGRTLCENCHRSTDTYGGKSIKRLKEDFMRDNFLDR